MLKIICRNGWIVEHCDSFAQICNEQAEHDCPSDDHRVTLDILKDGSINLDLTCAVFNSAYGFILVLSHKGLEDLNKAWDE